MKARLEFIINEPSHRVMFISETVDVTEDELQSLLTDSEYGTLKSNQWIKIDNINGFFSIENHNYPISMLKYVGIRATNEVDFSFSYLGKDSRRNFNN